jgi:hypothetical protein
MQQGLTDSICILGFADVTDSLYEGVIYPVHDINEALALFVGDDTNESSLVRGVIETYHAGCRDIYLYAVGGMVDYLAPLDRDTSWWASLYAKYNIALRLISENDDIDILIPYDCDVTKDEFVSQFAEHCAATSGTNLRLAIFSYNGTASSHFTGEDFRIIFVDGMGTFHFHDNFSVDYSSGMATVLAGLLSNIGTDVPPDNREVKVPIIFTSDYSGTEETLEENNIVGFRTTVGYERVFDSTLVTTLSYTRAATDSDFRALYTVHTIQRFLKGVKKLGLIGTAAYLAEETLKDYFKDFVNAGFVRNIEAHFASNAFTLYVDLTLYMHYPIGDVDLHLTVGPVY